MQQLLQVLLQLAEVDGGDEAFTGFGQAVPGQLGHLVVDEAEDPVGQRQDALWRVAVDELGQPLLHLSGGLSENTRHSNVQPANGPPPIALLIMWQLFLEESSMETSHPHLLNRHRHQYLQLLGL